MSIYTSIYFRAPANRLTATNTTYYKNSKPGFKKKRNKIAKVITQSLSQLQKSLNKAKANYKKAKKLNCNMKAANFYKDIISIEWKIYNMEVNNV